MEGQGQGIQMLEGSQLSRVPSSNVPRALQENPWCPLTVLSLCVFLALPAAAPLLHVFSWAGWVVEGLQNSPVWNGEDRRLGRSRVQSKGLVLASREACHWPSSQAWARGRSCLPLALPSSCPPGLLGC